MTRNNPAILPQIYILADPGSAKLEVPRLVDGVYTQPRVLSHDQFLALPAPAIHLNLWEIFEKEPPQQT